MMNVYLDNAATTKLSEGNIDYVSSIIRDYYGNANSHLLLVIRQGHY